MQITPSPDTDLLDRLEYARPLGFNALASRLLSIQTLLSILLSRPCRDPSLRSLFARARKASLYDRVALEQARGGPLSHLSSTAVERWLLRLLEIVERPHLLLAHAVSHQLHDLGTENLAHRLARRFVDVATLGPPSPVAGVRVDDLLGPPICAARQADVANEVEQVLALQEALCVEVYVQFIE